MKKIRYKEINPDKYEIILPSDNDQTIGYIYRNSLKKPSLWFIEPYFSTFYRDSKALNTGHDDFTKAGRALVDLWSYTSYLSSPQDTEDMYIGDMFKNLKP